MDEIFNDWKLPPDWKNAKPVVVKSEIADNGRPRLVYEFYLDEEVGMVITDANGAKFQLTKNSLGTLYFKSAGALGQVGDPQPMTPGELNAAQRAAQPQIDEMIEQTLGVFDSVK